MKLRSRFPLPPILQLAVRLSAGSHFLAAVALAGVPVDSISIADVSIAEGNADTVNINFTVTRSANGGNFSINYATADGTGVAPGDYTTTAGILNFTAGGNLTATVSVPVVGDTAPEPDETFLVNLSGLSGSGATIIDAQAQGTIIDEDRVAPVITAQPNISQTVVAGNAFTLTASASGAPAPAYQWYIGTPGVTTTPISGANSATLTTATAVDRSYWVRAANSKGTADSNAGTVMVESASNALLSSLTLSTGTLSPVFDPVVLTYSASVGSGVSSTDVTPTVFVGGAALSISVNGGAFAPGASGRPVTLSLVPGTNRIAFRTTATDGTTVKTSNLTVVRSPEIYTSANRDILEPNVRNWPVAGVALGGTQLVNLGLQGVGRVAAGTKDPATGENLGSLSDMQVTGFVNHGDGTFSGTLQTLPDRGYNSGLIFSNYAARLNTYSFTFSPYTAAAPTAAQNQIALTFAGSTRFTFDHDGNAATPPIFSTGLLADGPATTLFGTTVPVVLGDTTQSDGTFPKRLTLDTEGLIFDSRPGKSGSGWIGDEYGAYLYHFNASKQLDGQLLLPRALVPNSPVGTTNFLADPPLNGRRINQGMEGIAQSPDGKRVFALLQSATIQDSGSGNPGRSNTRLVVYDVSSSDTPVDPVAQYVIQLPRADDTGSTGNGSTVNRNCAQSAILALNNNQLLILARDGNGRGAAGAPVFKSVLLADLSVATNIDGSFDAEGSAVAPAGVLPASVKPIAWTEALNLIGKLNPALADVQKFGLNLDAAPGDINTIGEKWEALAMVSVNEPANPNDYFLFIGNDNDFQSATGTYLDAAGVLQPYDAGLENDTIILAYRVRVSNATPPPTVVSGSLSINANGSPLNLLTATGVSPVGGTFSGPGVMGNTFDPALAGSGANVITYTLGAQSVNVTVTVTSAPPVPALPTKALSLFLKSSLVLSDNGLATGNGGAEIPAFDPVSKRAFSASNVGIQVVDLTNPSVPVLLAPIDPTASGLGSKDVSHVIVRNGVLAVSLIATDKTLPGTVAFYQANNRRLLGSVTVGAVPDQLVFTPDGTKVLVANEGEMALFPVVQPAPPAPPLPVPAVPNPDGSVSIIDVSRGFAAPTVQTVTFAAFNGREADLRADGIRIFPGNSAAMDLEPEYIAISPDGTKAMVTLQEANAIAVLDIPSATFTAINPLGLKNFAPLLADFSDRDSSANGQAIELKTGLPAFGMFMPDAIARYESAGQTYYVTANEGDDRNDFLATSETTSVNATNYDLDNTVFPNEGTPGTTSVAGSGLKGNDQLGRLSVTNFPGLRGDLDGDGDIDRILSLGGRSFSILDANGKRIFDSGDVLDRILTTYYPYLYDDGRSDNKSAEPEGVAIAVLNGRVYAFIGVERSHAVMIFDVTDPANVSFTNIASRFGDLNPEGMLVVPAADSPTGKLLLLVANEVSYTLSTYEIAAETAPLQLQILHYYGESGLLGIQSAPILGALIDRFDGDIANTVVIGEGDSFIPGPWLVGGADPALNRVIHTGTFTAAADTTAVPFAQADIAIMNAFGTTVSALGNHEFDLGSPVLQAAVSPANSATVGNWSGARFPLITANLDFAGDSSLRGFADGTLGGTVGNIFRGNEVEGIPARIAPYAVKTVGGQKIGFIGATTFELLSKSSPNGTRPLDDANAATSDLQEVAAYLQSAVNALQVTGVNKIIMVDQLDTLQRNKDLAPLLTGVDVMVAGGGHERMGDATDTAVAFNGHDADFIADAYPIVTTGADGKPTLIVTTDTEYSYLGRLVVNFNAAGELILADLNPVINGAYAATEATLKAAYSTNNTAAAIIAASAIGTKVKAITDAINTVVVAKDSNVFGYTKVYMEGDRVFGRTQEVNLGDITADANAWKARAALSLPPTAAVFSLKNGGGIRASLGSVSGNGSKIPPPANPLTGKPAGAISQLDVENALRFDNKMMVFDTTPAGLLGILNFAAGLSSGPTVQNGGYPQVGNIRFSYESSRPVGQKVRSAALINDHGVIVARIIGNGVVLPEAPPVIQCVALNFTANGGDGYPIRNNPANPATPAEALPGFGSNFRYILTDGSLSPVIPITSDFTAAAVVPANALGEQKAFSDYLAARHATQLNAYDIADTVVSLDPRIQQIAFRPDYVLLNIIETWRQINFANAAGSGPNQGNLDDADTDGVINLLEFAFGTSPTSSASGAGELSYNGTFSGNGTLGMPGQPVTRFEPILNNIDFRAIFVRRKDYPAAGLTYTPQFSADLSIWQDSTAIPTVLADDGTWQIVSVPYTRSIAGRKARFFRIAVNLAP